MNAADTTTQGVSSTRLDWGQTLIDGILFSLLLALPLSLLGGYLDWSPVLVFILAGLALIPLAKLIGQVTEEIAVITGPTMGGLINATFGNATELIIGLIALRAGLVEVVKASLTGAIISNLLLVAGLAMFLGGTKYKEQSFRPMVARVNASVMNLTVVALLLPTAIDLSRQMAAPARHSFSIQGLSTAVAIVLMLVYVLTLLFSLKTHSYLYSLHDSEPEPSQAPGLPNPVLQARGSIPQILRETSPPFWQTEGGRINAWVWILCLVVLTGLVVLASELLVDRLEVAIEQLQLTPLFLGVILLPIVGNAAEHATAVTMAIKNKMDLSLSVAFGSTMQIALFVAPLLVLVGAAIGQPMDFSFGPVELVAVATAVLLVNSVSSDGRTNWLEGLLLLATYAILAVGFFYLG